MKYSFLMRTLLVAGWLAAFGSVPAAAAPDSGEWRFEVLLNDKPIGFHRFSLSRDGEGQVLESEARFDVRFLFVTAFRYRHDNVETWRGDCLTSVDARTDSNGKMLEVVGGRADGRFAVSSSNGRELLGDCVQSFAYWNPSILQADRLLNTQTGEYESINVAAEGVESFAVGEDVVDADRYTLSTKGGDITLWYTRNDQRWLALEAPAKGGRRIRYMPVALPDSRDFRVAAAGNN